MNKKYIFRFLSILIMALIFWFSSQDGDNSSKQSGRFKVYVEKILGRKIDNDFRKLAYFSIYFSLGSCMFLSRERRGKKEMMEVLFFTIVYAMSDEYHQSTVPGRGPSLRDVGIDTLGSLGGIITCKTINYYFQGRK